MHLIVILFAGLTKMMRIRKAICVLSLLSLLIPLVMFLLMDNDDDWKYREILGDPEFVIVVCNDRSSDNNSASSFQRQLRQISVLLKSAAALTSSTLRFNIVSDSFTTYELVTNITKSWPSTYRNRIVFCDYKEVFYPNGTEKMMNMFRPCATERLFLAQAYEEKDAMVFLDTDTLFLKPPENLWYHFSKFTSMHVIGIAPCLYMYGPSFKKFPTYGTSGLNAGVLLMNLTRIRCFEGGWTENILDIVEKYDGSLSLADQDILNILFSSKRRASQLYELGCEWNYRYKLCSKGRSKCKNARRDGVGLLHGITLSFVGEIEPKFKAVFDAWEQHCLEESLEVFLKRLKTTLDGQKRSRGCSRIRYINQLLLRGLENTLKWKEKTYKNRTVEN